MTIPKGVKTRPKSVRIVIDTIYDIMALTKQVEPQRNVYFLCERYKLDDQEKQQVLDWYRYYCRMREQEDYFNYLQKLYYQEHVTLALLGEGNKLIVINGLFSYEDNEGIFLTTIGEDSEGKPINEERTIPFTEQIVVTLQQ